jgi:hypothetical protein
MEEIREFWLCDDKSENYYVGRVFRKQTEVKPELWDLEPGEEYEIAGSIRFCRAS